MFGSPLSFAWKDAVTILKKWLTIYKPFQTQLSTEVQSSFIMSFIEWKLSTSAEVNKVSTYIFAEWVDRKYQSVYSSHLEQQ